MFDTRCAFQFDQLVSSLLANSECFNGRLHYCLLLDWWWCWETERFVLGRKLIQFKAALDVIVTHLPDSGPSVHHIAAGLNGAMGKLFD